MLARSDFKRYMCKLAHNKNQVEDFKMLQNGNTGLNQKEVDLLKILIIEDDDLQIISLTDHLESFFRDQKIKSNITSVTNEENANTILEKNKFDIAFFDLNLDDKLEGLDLLKAHSSKVAYPVILSSRDEKEIIKKGEKAGCKDFLPKPFRPESISFLYNRYRTVINEKHDKNFIFSRFITNDDYTKKQLLKIPELRNNKKVILINGPTGTGKQVVAETIYDLIHKGQGNFIEENCASIPKGLEESHLFGHKKGSFTDAKNDKKGLFELASGGVLFLDEIGKLPLSTQGKLLKVIEQKKFRPIGSEKELKFNGTIVTASCENLKSMVIAGTFRKDLYARISGTVIDLKPLNQRKCDIIPLIKHYIKTHVSGRTIELSKEAENFLLNYDWPENAREIVKEVDNWQTQGVIELTEEHLSHLKQKQIESNYEILTENNIAKIKEVGFMKFMEQIGEEAFKYFYYKNNNAVRVTMREIKMGNSSFYALRKKIEKKEKTNV